MRRILFGLGLVALCGVGGLWITRPQTVDATTFAGLTPDAANGALVFAAMGCASCHMDPDNPVAGEMPGGKRFVTGFGTFIAPNISMDPTHGIGEWTDVQLASAVMQGTGADGAHLYPAFPYASYHKATPQDVVDLIAHLRSLPALSRENQPHEVGFPFNIRAALGGWKLLFMSDDWVIDGDLSPEATRGRYLVEALGHCGECHTPRNALGGLDKAKWMQGAANPSGDGRIPGITTTQLDWSDDDIARFLSTGFTPDFDTVGGSMAEVVENLSQLPETDIAAIVAYLRVIGP